MSPKFTTDLENFIRQNEEERTELIRQNQVMLLSFVASFEERFPKEPDPEALARDKRDWFAGQAMAAIIAKLPLFGHMSDAADISIAVDSDGEASVMGEVARGAFGYADAMLAERSKP